MGCCMYEFYCILKAHLKRPKQIAGGFAGLVLFPVVVIKYPDKGTFTEKGSQFCISVHHRREGKAGVEAACHIHG